MSRCGVVFLSAETRLNFWESFRLPSHTAPANLPARKAWDMWPRILMLASYEELKIVRWAGRECEVPESAADFRLSVIWLSHCPVHLLCLASYPSKKSVVEYLHMLWNLLRSSCIPSVLSSSDDKAFSKSYTSFVSAKDLCILLHSRQKQSIRVVAYG